MTNDQKDDIDNVDLFTLRRDLATLRNREAARKSRLRVEAMDTYPGLLERAQARIFKRNLELDAEAEEEVLKP